MSDEYDAVRWALWYLTDEVYKNACEIFSAKKAYREKRAITVHYPEISSDSVVSYISPSHTTTIPINCELYREIFEKVSGISKEIS